MVEFIPQGIHSKSEKVSGTAFSVKKIAKTFWVILGPFRVFLGHFGSYLGHIGPFLGQIAENLQKVQFFCGIVGVTILAFRMYASGSARSTTVLTNIAPDLTHQGGSNFVNRNNIKSNLN